MVLIRVDLHLLSKQENLTPTNFAQACNSRLTKLMLQLLVILIWYCCRPYSQGLVVAVVGRCSNDRMLILIRVFLINCKHCVTPGTSWTGLGIFLTLGQCLEVQGPVVVLGMIRETHSNPSKIAFLYAQGVSLRPGFWLVITDFLWNRSLAFSPVHFLTKYLVTSLVHLLRWTRIIHHLFTQNCCRSPILHINLTFLTLPHFLLWKIDWILGALSCHCLTWNFPQAEPAWTGAWESNALWPIYTKVSVGWLRHHVLGAPGQCPGGHMR